MLRKATPILLILALAQFVFPQQQPQKPDDDQPIRITTDLVQMDVVVTDKNGRIVKDLTRADFELFENSKKLPISFFEFVDAGKTRQARRQPDEPSAPSPQGPSASDIRRIFAFVIDDLTIRNEDLAYVREMLRNFVTLQMQATDLVAIIRTVGGKGLLQQFSSDKQLLLKAISALTPRGHPFNVFNPKDDAGKVVRLAPTTNDVTEESNEQLAAYEDTAIDDTFISSPYDDTNLMLRAYMSLGTARFAIDSMRQLPGRKSLVLISGGLPLLSTQAGTAAGNVSNIINSLTDRATRAGVAIHTMDIKGLSAQSGVARFTDTPARSALPTTIDELRGGRGRVGFGRTVDEQIIGNANVMQDQLGLRTLASNTGGISVLNRNDFDEGLGKIIDASEGYYLLAYTPQGGKFDGDFRRVEIKVKREGLKVYSRRGYLAREEKATGAAKTKEETMLAAIQSPLASRDVDLDAMLLYKAMPPDKGAIDIHLVIDPQKLAFEQSADRHQASIDIAGFVFDESGKMRGGFSETVNASLNAQEYSRVTRSGFTYSANTALPAGIYQVRIGVRDNKTGRIGTLSRYLEVPDLGKGKLAASSLLLGAVPANDTKAAAPTPVSANREISRNQDLRYAVVIYNAKLSNGRPQVRTQLTISQSGKTLFKEAEETLSAGSAGQMIKVGQLGLARVPAGRYTLTLVITDTLADKKSQTITRNMDFIVVN